MVVQAPTTMSASRGITVPEKTQLNQSSHHLQVLLDMSLIIAIITLDFKKGKPVIHSNTMQLPQTYHVCI